MSEAIGVGLIGAGRFGLTLAAGVERVPGLRMVGIVDPDEVAAASAAARLDAPRVRSLDELMAMTETEAVIVATPHATHAPISTTALAAGRHVFVEKPLAITAADAAAIVRAADRAGRVLLVGHVTRLLPLVRAALERLDSGAIGEPLAAWMVRHQPLRRRGWMARSADFGMLLHSPAVHNVDLLDRVLGRPRQVTALAAGPIQDQVDYPDVVGLLVSYEGGAIGSLGATVSDPLYAPGGTSWARIVGSRGGMDFDIASGRLDVQRGGGELDRIEVDAPGWGLDEAVELELTSFVDAIRGDAEPFVSNEEALLAVAVVEAAARSIERGRPVDITDVLA